MKYLENDALQQLTAALTDAAVAGHSRTVNGRLECYSMKRAGNDKKYSKLLGERYVAEMQSRENELQTAYHLQQQETEQARTGGRKRSQSAGIFQEATAAATATGEATESASSSKYIKQNEVTGRRGRSASFDVGIAESSSSILPSMTAAVSLFAQRTALGDFSELATRKLMTNLILTLNASFSDYDFSSVKPTDFEKLSVPTAVQRVNEHLSELAMRKEDLLVNLWTAIDNVISMQECAVYSYAPVPAGTEEDDPLSFLTETLVPDQQDESMTAVSEASQTVLWTFNYFFVNRPLKRIIFFTCVETMRADEPAEEEEPSAAAAVNGPSDWQRSAPVQEFKWSQGADAADMDFDLDPAASVAGGLPIPTV